MTTAEILNRTDESVVVDLALRAQELAGMNEQQPIEMGLIAFHVKKNKLWRTQGFGGVTAWIEAHFQRASKTAQRGMRIVSRLIESEVYTRDELLTVGVSNAYQLSRLAPHILRESGAELLKQARVESVKQFAKTTEPYLAKAPDHRDTEFEKFTVEVVPDVHKRLLDFEARFMAKEELTSRADAWEFIVTELEQSLEEHDAQVQDDTEAGLARNNETSDNAGSEGQDG